MKKIVSLFLVILMLTLALASCGGKGGKGGNDTTTAEQPADTTTVKPADTTTVPVTTTTDKWESIGTEVKALTEDQRTLKFELSNFSNAELASKCQEYMAGPDALSAETSTIQRLVYQRNEAAKEALGLNITYEYVSYAWGQSAQHFTTLVQSNDAAAADLFCNMIYDIGNATLNSIFRDVLSMEDGYFDFTTDGWLYDFMQGLSFTGDRMYLLGSDYFLDMLRALVIIPFNVTLMDSKKDVLQSILLGADGTLPTGTEMSDAFFEFVADGKWTYDALIAICEAIFVDDGTTGSQDDMNDLLGFATSSYAGMSSSSFLYTTNTVVVETSTDADGKTVLTYPETNEALTDIALKLRALLEASGTVSSSSSTSIADIQTKFAADKVLFGGGGMLGSLELDVYQSMDSIFSVVPMPKMSETDSYNTTIHNIGNAGALNINSTKYIAISAFIQYCTENSADIRFEYMNIAMKYKTVEHNDGTDAMLDLIYDSIKESRQKAIDDTVGAHSGQKKWHAALMEGNYMSKTANFGDTYDEYRSAKQTALNDIVTIWYNLPKTAADIPAEPAEPAAQ